MKLSIKKIFIFIFIAILFVVILIWRNSGNLFLVSWVPYWDYEEGMKSAKMYNSQIDAVSLFWFKLDEGGHIEPYSKAKFDEDSIKELQGKGIKVYALIANLPEDNESDWDSDIVEEAIGDSDHMQVHVEEIVGLTNEYGFDGVDIDYENLDDGMLEPYTLFIKTLSEKLRAEEKTLGIAIHPKESETEDNGSKAQNWSELHMYVDHMYFMFFSQHTSDGIAGPNFEYEKMKRVLQYAISDQKVDAEKIVAELGVYGQSWAMDESENGEANKELTIREVEEIINDGAREKWDSKSQSPYLEYEDEDGVRQVVWYENKKSIKKKISLAKKFGVKKIGIWRMGGETQEIMEAFR